MMPFVRSMTLLVVAVASTAPAAAPRALDWTDWRELPVHDSGRVMPLDTLARALAQEICGRVNPRLAPPETGLANGSPGGGAGEGRRLFPGGQARKFTAAELLFSWLVEPDAWEDVPFLTASHEALRQELLDVPLVDRRGRRLKYVSPRQFEQATRAHARLAELARMQEKSRDGGQPMTLGETDRRLEQLNRAYQAYRVLGLDAKGPERRRTAFLGPLMRVFTTWRRELARPLALWQSLAPSTEAKRLVDEMDGAARQLLDMLEAKRFSLRAAEEPVAKMCRAARSLAALAAQRREAPLESDDPATREEMTRQYERLMGVLAEQTARLLDECLVLREAMYDTSRVPRVMPSLSPLALNDEQQPGEKPQPWITLEMLLYGSAGDLDGYPAKKLGTARAAFDHARAAYLDRSAPDRPERFAKAMGQFAAAMRSLGQAIEPARRKLVRGVRPDEAVDATERVAPREEDALSATAYPPAGAMHKEVCYNRLDPFLWSWVLTLAAIVALALGFGAARKPMFFVGAALVAAGAGFTVAGLLLRASITGMVPVTNMYETVLFAAAAVALLGLWFAMLPVTGPIFSAAWRVTALSPTPAPAASIGFSGDTARWFWRTMPWLRLLLMPAVLYALAIGHFNPSERGPIFPLLPSFTSITPSGLVGGLVIWLVGLALLGWALWLVPRVLLAIPLVVTLTPKAVWILLTRRLTRPVNQVVARRPFLLAGAVAALVAYLLAYYVPGPVFNREVGLGMAALLRSNFWLALHVLIVTASYGAGALAWALAVISLLGYALGTYREPKRLSPETLAAGHRPAGGYQAPESALTRRPPAMCAKLATYIYKAVQLAVVLLAAGTITGAIWADYAWGRYWGWDPKEVWALISLLVYLAVLHGRWAGWTGNFGIAVGAVLGAIAILMTWYGVNFVLKGGLHSYGQSSGGEFYVVLAVLANLLLVVFATVRYLVERHTAAASGQKP